MNKVTEITNDILSLTMLIDKTFPELTKYINEMPVTIPNAVNPEINAITLSEYKKSLEVLLNKYKNSIKPKK